jgi:hypothetical protein
MPTNRQRSSTDAKLLDRRMLGAGHWKVSECYTTQEWLFIEGKSYLYARARMGTTCIKPSSLAQSSLEQPYSESTASPLWCASSTKTVYHGSDHRTQAGPVWGLSNQESWHLRRLNQTLCRELAWLSGQQNEAVKRTCSLHQGSRRAILLLAVRRATCRSHPCSLQLHPISVAG